MKNFLPFLLLFLCVSQSNCAQRAVEPAQEPVQEIAQEILTINSLDIKKHIQFLASDELAGRLAGSEGEKKAADYILSQFKAANCELLYDGGFQTFSFLRWLRIDSTLANSENFEGEVISRGSKNFYTVDNISTTSTNVVCMVRGTKNSDEYIVVGAHYDHLGAKRFGDTTIVFYGADDNASGVAVLIESAKFIAGQKPERNIIFVAFSAEEKGMHGSKSFIENPPVPKENIIAMLNIDMVGHLDSVLIIGGVHTAVEFDSLITVTQAQSDFQVHYCPKYLHLSDQWSFYAEKIPVLFFRTFGLLQNVKHYHRSSDTWEIINHQGVADIAICVSQLILQLANAEQSVTFR
jgi:Zn-dependent M28 family amino/carboxypeptidase